MKSWGNKPPLPWWERIEVRGIHPHPFGKLRTGLTFPLQREKELAPLSLWERGRG
jgi:hypothetical protein